MLSIMRATIVMVLVSAATATSGSGSGDDTPAAVGDIFTSTSAAVSAGATTIPLADVDGIKVGDTLSITDGNNTDISKIIAVNAGATRQRREIGGTVTVANPLANSYAAGSNVTVTTNVDASSTFEYHDAPLFGLLVFVVLTFFFTLLTASLVSDVEEDAESTDETSTSV